MDTRAISFIQAGFLLVAGYFFAHMGRKVTEKLLCQLNAKRYQPLVERIIFYGILSLFFLCTLNQLGFDLGVLLGAAGVFSIAIGFSAQTSIANFISGLLLIFENSIAVGDTIVIDNSTGEVLAIDWLSTKLKTADQVFIRIPNETLLKNKLMNLSILKQRRLELTMLFPYTQSLTEIQSIWSTIVAEHTACLKTPLAEIAVQSVQADCIHLMLLVWVESPYYTQLKNELYQTLLTSLIKKGIKLYTPVNSICMENIDNR